MQKKDKLDVILRRAIYEGIRAKCRGRLTVEIKNNKCFIDISFDDLEYTEIIDHVAEKILNGEFTSDKVVYTFIWNWQEYVTDNLYKKLFYSYS